MHWKEVEYGAVRSKVKFAFLKITDPKTRYVYWLEPVEIQQEYIAYYNGGGFWQTVRVLPIQVAT
jgi:hypothetical protein